MVWLNEGQLVERLVDKLSPDADPEDHASADNLLCEISTSCRDTSTDGHQQTNPLRATLESEDTVNKLLDLLLHEDRNDSSLSHVINILLTLLSARTQQQQIQHLQQQQQGLQQYAAVDSSDSESSDGRKHAVARIIAKRLPRHQSENVTNVLKKEKEPELLLTETCITVQIIFLEKALLLPAYSQEVEPLGNTHLQVVSLVTALVALSDPVVHDSLYELNTVEYLLDLFFKFMLNHFLHTQVEQCLTAILTKAPAASSPEGDTDHRLLTQLFNDGRIIERVLEAFDESSERQECKQIHMGHLRQLANTIVQQAEFGPNEHRIKQLIQGLPGDKATQWDDFVSNVLAELNRKNEITPLPCTTLYALRCYDFTNSVYWKSFSYIVIALCDYLILVLFTLSSWLKQLLASMIIVLQYSKGQQWLVCQLMLSYTLYSSAVIHLQFIVILVPHWIHMLSGNATAGEQDWGLATVEADETDESPQRYM
ncbi:serine/threonine-protein phosphatase 6 regulatory subunit 3-like [Penaeus indicus]|uniref:serine/threonine-protein phosphatase 6 regulatory subunit 3-like n=1 Tax=Penaeus indicus TaxID=29960 RepID=UPI00300C6AE3